MRNQINLRTMLALSFLAACTLATDPRESPGFATTANDGSVAEGSDSGDEEADLPSAMSGVMPGPTPDAGTSLSTRDAASSDARTGCGPAQILCAGLCTDQDETHCEATCRRCPSVANGAPVCSLGRCTSTCSAGYRLVGAQCAREVDCFRDADGDGHGDAAQPRVFGGTCGPGYVRSSDDCADSDARVYPGQSRGFGSGYSAGGRVSFDFDCDGQESIEGSFPRRSSSPGCSVTALGCKPVGGGYISSIAMRGGPGVDPLCGSTTIETPDCNAGNAFHCRLAGSTIQSVPNSPPVLCR
jgi:hypothetical protein